MKTKIIAIIAILGLMSCNGVKNLRKPNLDMPETYIPAMETDSACIADLDWWKFYTDTTLCALIQKTLDNNRDLLKAAAKIEEVRNLYGIDRLNYLPEISGVAGANHETNRYNGIATTKDPEYDLKMTIGWEINLLGAMTWSQKGSLARYKATIDDYHAMRMALVAETAGAYFRLMALRNELAIVRQTLATREESLNQARIRFEGGLTSETVYQQAKVEYASTAALVPNLEQQVKVANNAITMLIGEFPNDSICPDQPIRSDNIQDNIPVGVSSTLLERRPDISAAEHRLAAAMADVGLSYANQFPNISLSFTPGWENESLSRFFASPFTYVVGNIAGTIFDFGRKKRKYKAAIAIYEQARNDYEKTVINAFTEVNTAIETLNKVKENRKLKAELCEASMKYVNLAQLQYRAGSLNYIDVLDAQRRYFDAQIAVSNALRDEYLALTNLYKVLGGGWDTSSEKNS